jgi:hypothetical protein
MNAKYESTCACGEVTTIYRDPAEYGLGFPAGSADINDTCRCGNGGFLFRLVSKKLRAEIKARKAAASSR